MVRTSRVAALVWLAASAGVSLGDDEGIEYFIGAESESIAEVDARPMVVDGALPSWLRGSYFVGGPHYHNVGTTKITHFLDGLGVLYKFDLAGDDADGATWSSKVMASQLKNASDDLGRFAPCVMFRDTEPPRGDRAYQNVFATNDNDYVVQMQVGPADAGEYLGFTDDESIGRYGRDMVFHEASWDDSLVPRLHMGQSVAHAVRDEATGDLYDLMMVTAQLPSQQSYASIFVVRAAAPTVREELARVPIDTVPYEHSFGFDGSRYAVICEHAFVLDSSALFDGDMFMDAANINASARTKLHVVDLTNGSTVAYESPEAFLCIHFANLVHNGTALVFDMPTWASADVDAPTAAPKEAATKAAAAAASDNVACNPYAVFDFDRVANKTARDAVTETCSNHLARHALHTDGALAGTATYERLDPDDGWFEYPTFNWKFRGSPKSCIMYFTANYGGGSPSFGALSMVKFDTCARKTLATWVEHRQFPSEPHFVANPTGRGVDGAEDDGVIVTTVMNGTHAEHESYLLVLDAADFGTLARLPLGEHVAATVHGWFDLDLA